MTAGIPVLCPCCRASNDVGPTCRRCKADLSLLFAIANRRGFLLSEARKLVADGKPTAALRSLKEAATLRAGDDIQQLTAAVQLLAGEYATALATYDGLANYQPGNPGRL